MKRKAYPRVCSPRRLICAKSGRVINFTADYFATHTASYMRVCTRFKRDGEKMNYYHPCIYSIRVICFNNNYDNNRRNNLIAEIVEFNIKINIILHAINKILSLFYSLLFTFHASLILILCKYYFYNMHHNPGYWSDQRRCIISNFRCV